MSGDLKDACSLNLIGTFWAMSGQIDKMEVTDHQNWNKWLKSYQMKCMKYRMARIIIGLICTIIAFVAPKAIESQAQGESAFTLKYVVDRMTTQDIVIGEDGFDNAFDTRTLSGRYNVTYRVQNNGSFFLEVFILDSPWENATPFEMSGGSDEGIRRLLLTPDYFFVYSEQGVLLFKQAVQDMSWPEELFLDGFDPLGLRNLILSEGNRANREHLLQDGGAVVDQNGFVIFQSCGQIGPLRTLCDPGDCSRVVYHPAHLRPVMAEHSKPGQDPYYLQYFQWSKDGSSLLKTFEKESIQFTDGTRVMISCVSHYFDFSITK